MKVWQHGKDCVVAEYGDRHIDPYQCYDGDHCGGSWMQLVPAAARIVNDQAIIIEKDDPLYADVGQLIWMRR